MTELSDYQRLVEKPMIEAKDAEIARLRTAIFNTINDLGHKKPNLKAMRSYLSAVYNAPR